MTISSSTPNKQRGVQAKKVSKMKAKYPKTPFNIKQIISQIKEKHPKEELSKNSLAYKIIETICINEKDALQELLLPLNSSSEANNKKNEKSRINLFNIISGILTNLLEKIQPILESKDSEATYNFHPELNREELIEIKLKNKKLNELKNYSNYLSKIISDKQQENNLILNEQEEQDESLNSEIEEKIQNIISSFSSISQPYINDINTLEDYTQKFIEFLQVTKEEEEFSAEIQSKLYDYFKIVRYNSNDLTSVNSSEENKAQDVFKKLLSKF